MIASPPPLSSEPVRRAVPCQWCRTPETVTERGAVLCPKCDFLAVPVEDS